MKQILYNIHEIYISKIFMKDTLLKYLWNIYYTSFIFNNYGDVKRPSYRWFLFLYSIPLEAKRVPVSTLGIQDIKILICSVKIYIHFRNVIIFHVFSLNIVYNTFSEILDILDVKKIELIFLGEYLSRYVCLLTKFKIQTMDL